MPHVIGQVRYVWERAKGQTQVLEAEPNIARHATNRGVCGVQKGSIRDAAVLRPCLRSGLCRPRFESPTCPAFLFLRRAACARPVPPSDDLLTLRCPVRFAIKFNKKSPTFEESAQDVSRNHDDFERGSSLHDVPDFRSEVPESESGAKLRHSEPPELGPEA